MLIVFIKTVIIALLVFLVLRIMGKRQIGEMQPFEFVITFMLAEVACLPMNDPYIPLHFGIVPIVTLGMLDVLLSFIGRKSLTFRKVVDGKSVLVVDRGNLVYDNLKKMNMSVDDVIESLRASGYPDVTGVAYCIVEPNGKVSVVPSEQTKPLRPLALVLDGKLIKENMSKTGVDEAKITHAVGGNVKDVLYMDIRQNGTAYICPKKGESKTAKITVKGDAW